LKFTNEYYNVSSNTARTEEIALQYTPSQCSIQSTEKENFLAK